jgi:hypothetical protein
MRLRILDSGHGFGTKALFALIQTVSRHARRIDGQLHLHAYGQVPHLDGWRWNC